MAAEKVVHLLLMTVIWSQASAQDQIEEICYGPESVVVAVIVTLIVTLCLLAAGLFLYRSYWKTREDKHLMLVTDVENPNDQYAFDNPCFREATPIKHNLHNEEKHTSRLEKNKWLGWSPLNPFGKEHKPEKVTSLDDSYINDSRLKVVSLKSHDFTGLGFNICGNMRDGIFIKDVLHRGPAFESGCINAGDRIDSVCISFRNMVFEDALAILSYASPYDVQVQVENDSYSRPSTLIRSKRESNAISSTDRILHPKYSRSQSITHLNEIGKSNNKRVSHHVDYMHEKNRINHSLNRTHNGGSNEYPTIKMTTPVGDPKKERQKLEKHAAPDHKKPHTADLTGTDHQTKHQKFGIKVLPINTSPKSADGSTKTPKGPPKPPMVFENEINSQREKPATSPHSSTPNKKQIDVDEVDGSRENVKGMLAKSFQNLKEKINQNTLGKKKNKDQTDNIPDGKDTHQSKMPNETMNGMATKLKEPPKQKDNNVDSSEVDGPVLKTRSSPADGGDNQNEKSKPNNITIPEEVSKAGDVARNNRKSLNDPNSCRKSLTSMVIDPEPEINTKSAAKKIENLSDSENSTDGDSLKTSDETKKPKRSKGKAPPPPAAEMPQEGKTTSSPKRSAAFLSNEINEIKKDPENPSTTPTNKGERTGSTDSEPRIISLKDDKTTNMDDDGAHVPGYDSDSDVEPPSVKPKSRPNNTKIELTSTQVTVHQSSSGDNDEDIEPSRKAASLGDLSKLDSEQPLSIVLERAVSLDLADGGGQSGKKRKAPLPPSEEFPAVFDDLSYRKEPRLEHSLELNTFQRRLKKSSDFGTLEDALNEGPKSLEIEINRRTSPIDVTETHNSNIQEFSSWLAECRRPKSSFSETSGEDTTPSRVSSTSLVNINSSQEFDKETDSESICKAGNVSFSVNGKNFPTISCDQQNLSFPATTSKTVVVISQPNSLEPGIVEAVPVNVINEDDKSTNSTIPKESQLETSSTLTEQHEDTTLEPFVTAQESKFESLNAGGKLQEDDHQSVPKLPTSPIPVMSGSSTLSSPLSSSLTYITEIKVSTAEKNDKDPKSFNETQSSVLKLEPNTLKTSTPKPEITNSISKRIQQFDVKPNSLKPLISPIKKSNFGFSDLKNDTTPVKRENYLSHESSKIPIKTMKSETGQKVLATIQSLATKDVVPTKIPEVEYAKRVASLFSGNSLERKQANLKKRADNEATSQPNVSGFYLKGPETTPKPTKEINSVRKVPPTVPPRKMETSLSSRSSGEFEGKNRNESSTGSSGSVSGQSANDKTKGNEAQERNIVTFSSFVPKKQNEEQSNNSTLISFKIK